LQGDFQKKAAYFRDVAAAALTAAQRAKLDARVKDWRAAHPK